MKFAICDDDLVQLEYLEELVLKWTCEKGIDCDIFKYSCADELLFNYYPNRFDVLLLDIQMTGLNGINLAKKIRSLGDEAAIIFITALLDYVLEGYNVGAVQYLLKPFDEQKLYEALDGISHRSKKKSKIIFENDEKRVAVFSDDIAFAEAFSHKTKIVLENNEFFTNKSIGEIQKQLGEDFYKCHRSYLVNIKHINVIKKYELVMDNGSVVPISRRIYKDVNEAFISYYRR